jgi:hypothetical protein
MFAYEVQNQTVPNHITLNWTTWSQTNACITNLSCVHKREKRAQLMLTDTIFFFGGGFCPFSHFLKVQEAGSISNVMQRST